MGLKFRRLMATVHLPPQNVGTGQPHSPGRVALTITPKAARGGVKKPDTGKDIAGVKIPAPALAKIPLKPNDKVAMGAGWAQAIRDKLKGEKKAQAARRKSDKADKAHAALLQRPAAPTGPAAPFVPRVQLGGQGSGPHGGFAKGPSKSKVAAYQKAHKPDTTKLEFAGPVVSKSHPINPLKIKAPKGSSQAPGKSIGPIHVAPSAMSDKRVVVRMGGDWDEDKHPRGHGGKFAPGGGDKSEHEVRREGHQAGARSGIGPNGAPLGRGGYGKMDLNPQTNAPGYLTQPSTTAQKSVGGKKMRERARTRKMRLAERAMGAASAGRAIALCGGPGSGVPGPCPTGAGSHHEKGQQAAAGALSTAGKWFGGTSETQHESGQATQEAKAGAHDHLTSQGFQKVDEKSIFGAPNGRVATYQHPDGRKASITTSYMTGKIGTMSIKVKK